jgi:S1-C subfamily serine protease
VLHPLKSLLGFVAVLFAFSTTPVFARHPAVVRLTVPMPEGARSLGSGVLAGTDEHFGYVLTAQHVVRDAKGKPKVSFANGAVEHGEVVKSDAASDLALIRVARPQVQPAEWADASPAKGDQLVAAGFGSDGKYQEALGPVVGFSGPTDKAPDWMVVKTEVRSGDSGGPVFTKDGKLAGVLWGCNGNTYASHLKRLRSFTHGRNGPLFRILRQ